MKTETTGDVLCATDFSSGAYDAATAAEAWARRTASRLLLVHALDLPADPLISDMDRRNIVAHAKEKLEAQAAHLRTGDTPISTRLLEVGLAEDALVRFIADAAPSVVFLSSRRKIAIGTLPGHRGARRKTFHRLEPRGGAAQGTRRR